MTTDKLPQITVIAKADYEALARFRRVLRRFLHFTEEGAREEGLTPQQHQTLLAIKGQPGRDWASVGELADALQLKPNTVVGLVDRSEAAGLVHRVPAAEDRRQVEVHLTVRGEEVLAHLSQRNLAELRALRAALDAAALEKPARMTEEER
jgi:DNA-binding MarR family transcriptional regulator